MNFQVGIDFGATSVLENLNKFTRYAIVVQAFNSQGPGPTSVPQHSTTLPDGKYITKKLRLCQIFNLQLS